MKRIMCSLSLLLVLSMPTPLHAQSGGRDEAINLSASYDVAKIYPALTPRSYIKVGYAALSSTIFRFNPDSPATYIIETVAGAANRFSPERVDTVTADGVAYISFDPHSMGVEKNDQLNVGMKVKRLTPAGYVDIIVWHSVTPLTLPLVKTPVTAPDIDNYTLKLEPDIVPNQELVTGEKKTVGHFKFSLDAPSLIKNENVARFYFSTDNLFSTNGKDKSTKIELKTGAERTLLSSWYVPGNVEAKLVGNQPFSNSSFVVSSGIKTILPWAWTKPLLFNSVVKAPISPEFQFSAQYEMRLKRDVETAKKFPNKNDFRGFGQVAWSPIHILTGKNFSPNDISLELYGRAWWFPTGKIKSGIHVHRLESQFEASLLIPLGQLSVSEIFLKKPESGTNNRLRIKYISGANEASGFKRSSQFTIGIEASK